MMVWMYYYSMPKNTICSTCGQPKDRRARECKSCGNRRKALLQWESKSSLAKLSDSLRESWKSRKRSFDDISEDTRWRYKTDGRAYTFYWERGKRKWIYRHQWVWIKHHGAIPRGHQVHHIDFNRTNDALSNLECIPRSEHLKIHQAELFASSLKARGYESISDSERYATCEQCGKQFSITTRAKSNRFCSQKCYWESMKGGVR